MRKLKLQIGSDGQSRALLSAFQSVTSRNQPSTNKFLFGPSRWIRGLIKPARDEAVAYLDWSSQEVAIAAGLSGDAQMIEDYGSDIYLRSHGAGLVPADATKQTRIARRATCPRYCSCFTSYGSSAKGFSTRSGLDFAKAKALIGVHRRRYARFWTVASPAGQRPADRRVSTRRAVGRCGSWPRPASTAC